MLVLVGAVALTAMSSVAQGQAQDQVAAGAAPVLVADWEMDDPPGSLTMVDATGNHNGAISPNAASAGLTLSGSEYQWSLRCPACPPTALARVVQVPDSSALAIPDPSVTQTIEFRFRTPKGYGNIMQKGQATDTGGEIKIENPNGYTQCVYVGANRSYVAVPSPIRLNDNQWHVFKCVHTSTQIQTWVDGVKVASRNFVTGAINNTQPFVIGGKTRCDQVTVTCDYYTGELDWVHIYSGSATPTPNNKPPTAAFTFSCSRLSCTLDGSTSVDPEGGALSYAWTLGDNTTATGKTVGHNYTAPGAYPVTLSVTDSGGLTTSVTHTVTVRGASGVSTSAKPPAASLEATPRTMAFGRTVALVGTLANKRAGESVRILETQCGTSRPTVLATLPSENGGAFSYRARPLRQTVYTARVANGSAGTATVTVMPRLRLGKIGRSRYKIRVFAADSLDGKVATFQRYRKATKRWIKVRRLVLHARSNVVAPTVVSATDFSSRIKAGGRVRVTLGPKQVGSCYLPGRSNTIRS